MNIMFKIKKDYIDKCCICLFEFYEDIINYDFTKILK